MDALEQGARDPQLHDWATDTLAAAAVWAEMRAEMEKQEAADASFFLCLSDIKGIDSCEAHGIEPRFCHEVTLARVA